MPGGTLELLVLQKNVTGLNGTRVLVTALPLGDSGVSAKDVLNNSGRTRITIDAAAPQVIRAAHSVSLGGKKFFRADYKQFTKAGEVHYLSHAVTTFRGYYLVASVMADSRQQLDEAANLLKTILFQQDVVNRNCIVGPDEFAGHWRTVAGAPKEASLKPNPSQRIHVSMSVSEALLITKVEPDYPEDARKAGVHGPVVLNAIIGPNGEVQEATATEGDPLLVSAATAAAKQWKYKPYLLAGQPVTMDTTVKVDFPEAK